MSVYINDSDITAHNMLMIINMKIKNPYFTNIDKCIYTKQNKIRNSKNVEMFTSLISYNPIMKYYTIKGYFSDPKTF